MYEIIYKQEMDISVISTGILTGFSCFFMTNIVSISPIYFFCLFALYVFLLMMRWVSVPYESRICYFLYILYALYFPINACINQTRMHDALIMFFFSLYYIFTDLLLYQISTKKNIISTLKIYYIINIIYFIGDLCYRVYGGSVIQNTEIPTWIEANPIYKFYLYKTNSFAGDSNTIGVFALTVFSIAFFHYKHKIITFRYPFLLFIILILSFCRAAWVAAILFLMFYYLFYKANAFIKLFFIVVILFFGFIVFIVFQNDGSFLSKLDIFNKTFIYLRNLDLVPFIIGNGANTSSSILGLYAHNLFSILIIEYGLLGLVLCFFVFLFMAIDCKQYSFFILLPYLIVSLSYTPIFFPYLYSAICLVKHTNRIYNYPVL
jgi:hypothetical protein